jgi:Phage integrase, N-terminal SAM-like domain
MADGRRLFEVARERIRTRHLALRTEQAYLHWMRRYVKFRGRKHPRELGPSDVESFLTHLAVDAKFGASTQNQALQALLFLYRQCSGSICRGCRTLLVRRSPPDCRWY